MKLNLTLPLPTSINRLYINQATWNSKTRTRMLTGKRILSKEGEKTKEQIIQKAKHQMEKSDWSYDYTKENYIYMDTIIYFRKKGSDDNNIYKLLCDALEKVVYENDSRVLIRTQKILYDSENPRVEVTFSPVEYIGIFDNQEILDQFEAKCKTCKRYKNNCSILRKAKEGRIQEEIDNELNCERYKRMRGE